MLADSEQDKLAFMRYFYNIRELNSPPNVCPGQAQEAAAQEGVMRIASGLN